MILWDMATGNKVQQFDVTPGHGARVAFAADGNSVATGSDDGTVHVWQLNDPQEPQAIELKGGHKDSVLAVAFTPDGRRLVSADRRGRVLLWDLAKNSYTVLADLKQNVWDVKVSPDGRYVAFPIITYPGKVYLLKLPADG
jgi:WD40 repeat protein